MLLTPDVLFNICRNVSYDIGVAVSSDYESLRAEAREYALGRNKMFEASTRAYLS